MVLQVEVEFLFDISIFIDLTKAVDLTDRKILFNKIYNSKENMSKTE
jgi:hypothetical protein